MKQRPKNPPLPGDWAYTFKCAICTKGIETVDLTGKNWTDIVRVAIYNLVLQEKRKGSNKRFFQYKEEICSYIDKHWDSLAHDKTRTKTWENTIGSSLSTKSYYFRSGAEEIGSAGYWGLTSEEDPSYIRATGMKIPGASKKQDKKKKGGKAGLPKKKRDIIYEETSGVLSQNKPAKRKVKPIPTVIYYPRVYFEGRRAGYDEQCLAKENSALQVKIYPDRLTAFNERGHRMVRSSFPAIEGAWYYEVDILEHRGNSRIGWATEKGDVQGPTGYDKHSYSYRDKEGTKFHQSKGYRYGQPYGPGDTVGFYIYLPPKQQADIRPKSEPEPAEPGQKLVKKEEDPPILLGSEIIYYKNGASQGVAFSNIFEGAYYPAASLYGGAQVRFNFGPSFRYPPKDKKFTPCSNLVPPPELQENIPPDTNTTGSAQLTAPLKAPDTGASSMETEVAITS